jgi:ABC-2 type transport system ATP-binding protein
MTHAVGPNQAAVIEAHDLQKRFGAVNAVDGIDLALPAGRIYGLLGPNGSGKTTLIRLLTGLARPTSGYAMVAGVRMPSRSNLARIGYMTQAEGLYAELSVWENLHFFATLSGATDRSKMMAALELVQLDRWARTPVHELSGGMRRRLSLACALAHRPPVLFLDEPTVGVDPALRRSFWEHLRSLAARGDTLLVASHVMDEAERCDELLFIRAGKVVASGDADALRQRAGTRDLEAAFLKFAAEAGVGSAEESPR